MTTGYKQYITGDDTVPAQGGYVVTPSDSNEQSPYPRALWIGGAGNVKVTHLDGSVAIYTAVNAGQVLPVECKLVWATSTTATPITAMY